MSVKKYKIIYADPHWGYVQKKVRGGAERHYPTMNIEDRHKEQTRFGV